MLRTGGVVVLVVSALVVGGAVAVTTGFVDLGGHESTPTPTPEAPSDETPAETGTPEPTPTEVSTATPESTSTPTPDDGVHDENAINVAVYKHNDSNSVESGKLTIYDESGSVVDEFDLDRRPANTFDGLTPDRNYTAEVSEVGAGNIWPDVSRSFDPGETDSLDIVTGFDFAAADSYRYQLRHIRHSDVEDGDVVENPTRWLSKGKYDDESVYLRFGSYDRWNSPAGPIQMIDIDNKQFYNSQPTNGWVESDHLTYNPLRMPEHYPVQKSLDKYDHRLERTFVGTRTLDDSTVPEPLTERDRSLPDEINGTEAHVYELTFDGYSEWTDLDYEYNAATVYVDPDTGYVLRWSSHESLLGNVGMVECRMIIDFYDHDAVQVDPDEYDTPS